MPELLVIVSVKEKPAIYRRILVIHRFHFC